MSKNIDINALFPLYKELAEIVNDDIQMNWGLFSSKISALSEKDMEILYGLIFTFYIKENKVLVKEDKKILPYKGKILSGNQGVLFHIVEFPLKLQQLIWAYVNL